jgi:DNA-binding NtrC family response regulator
VSSQVFRVATAAIRRPRSDAYFTFPAKEETVTDCPVLIASSDLENRQALRDIFVELGLDPLCSASMQETQETLANTPVSIIFCERSLSDGSFRELLAQARKANPQVCVVVTSRIENRDDYLEAIRLGAFEVIPFPCHPTDVDWVIIRAMRHCRQKRALAMTA